MKFISIENIKFSTVGNGIPSGYDLVVYEKGTDPDNGCVLYGFDEIDLYPAFGIRHPAYGFLRIED